MALGEEGGTGMIMPVAPAYGGGFGGNGFGGFGGDWAWIILLLLAFGGGWGNGFGGGMDNIYPWMNQSNQISDGFRDSMLGSQIGDISTAITSGFGDVQNALCNGFNQTQMNILQSVNGIQAQLAQCCCDNRLATCQTQNIVQNEGAETRAAILSGVQSVLNMMCQDKIDQKNDRIVELTNRINYLEENNYVQNALTAQTQYLINQLGGAAAAPARV